MKKVAILFIVLLISSFLFAQNTYVPDDKFEQALIDLGYDTTSLSVPITYQEILEGVFEGSPI